MTRQRDSKFLTRQNQEPRIRWWHCSIPCAPRQTTDAPHYWSSGIPTPQILSAMTIVSPAVARRLAGTVVHSSRTSRGISSSKHSSFSFAAAVSTEQQEWGISISRPPVPAKIRRDPLKPESQLVLRHLQDSYPDWIESKDESTLSIDSKSGTFRLDFPNHNWRIWTSYDAEKNEHWLKVYTIDMFSRYQLNSLNAAGPEGQNEIAEKVDEMVGRMTRWGK